MQTLKTLLICLLLVPSAANAFCFKEAGKEFDIGPQLLEAIAMTESNSNPLAVGKNRDGTRDIGLMQINSSWIGPLGLKPDKLISDPCYNTMTGAKILRQCIDRHGYTWKAVGCYNATSRPKRVDYSWKIYNKLRTEGKKRRIEHSGIRNTQSSLQFSVRETMP